MRRLLKFALAVALGAAGGLGAAEGMARLVPGLTAATAVVVSVVSTLCWCDCLGVVTIDDWE